MEDIKPVDVHKIKKGSYIVLEGEPCIVKDVKFSAPGKHGHGKFRISAVGIFDDKKRIQVKSGKVRVDVPIIHKKTGQVLSIMGEQLQIMDMETYETFKMDIPKDEELKKMINEGSQINYWKVMGKKQIKDIKT